MRKYTEKHLKNFERDEYGRLICPTGDYTAIESFSEQCRFGERCSFGEACRFGEHCNFGDGCKHENLEKETLNFMTIGYIGSRNDQTSFFKLTDGIYVRCGCFSGYMNEFKAKIKETHGTSKHAEIYLKACELVEMQFRD